MFIVMRKFKEDTQWNICGVFKTTESADAWIEKEIKTGREAKRFDANCVYVAENGNHTWC